jgi:hypothetical protein
MLPISHSYKPNFQIKNSGNEKIWSFKSHYVYILTYGTRTHTWTNKIYRLTTAKMRFLRSIKNKRREII